MGKKSQNVYLNEELLEKVKQVAKETDRSVSYVVVKAIEKLLGENVVETPKEV